MNKNHLLFLLLFICTNLFSQSSFSCREEIRIYNKILLDTILLKSFSEEELSYLYDNTGTFRLRVYVDNSGFVTKTELISIAKFTISDTAVERLLCNAEIYGRAYIPNSMNLLPDIYRCYDLVFAHRK
jgi:hypothetical protein